MTAIVLCSMFLIITAYLTFRNLALSKKCRELRTTNEDSSEEKEELLSVCAEYNSVCSDYEELLSNVLNGSVSKKLARFLRHDVKEKEEKAFNKFHKKCIESTLKVFNTEESEFMS